MVRYCGGSNECAYHVVSFEISEMRSSASNRKLHRENLLHQSGKINSHQLCDTIKFLFKRSQNEISKIKMVFLEKSDNTYWISFVLKKRADPLKENSWRKYFVRSHPDARLRDYHINGRTVDLMIHFPSGCVQAYGKKFGDYLLDVNYLDYNEHSCSPRKRRSQTQRKKSQTQRKKSQTQRKTQRKFSQSRRK